MGSGLGAHGVRPDPRASQVLVHGVLQTLAVHGVSTPTPVDHLVSGHTSMGSDLVASLFLPSDGEYVLVDGMLRRLRLQYPDAIHHLMARGKSRQDIVCDDVDRDRLQEHLERAAIRCSWHGYAFAIMSNHLTGGSSEVAVSSIESRQWCAESHVASGDANRDSYRVCHFHESLRLFVPISRSKIRS